VNRLVLALAWGLVLLLAMPGLASPHDPSIPEEVKQWVQQCEIGSNQDVDVMQSCRRAVDALEIVLPHAPVFAASLNRLAASYRAHGLYAKAEALYLRGLRIQEEVLGPEHLEVAQSLNDLADLSYEQAMLGPAESYALRSLRIREKTLSPEHPAVARSRNSLARAYYAQGNYSQAELLYERDLHILEQALGPEHLDIVPCLNGLAGISEAKGNYAQAELLYMRSVRIREKALGVEHPSVATLLVNLAGMYKDQGRYADAKPLYERGLHLLERALGPDHPKLAKAIYTLATLYQDQGSYAQATPLLRRSIRMFEKTLGPEHPSLAAPLNALASIDIAQERPAQALLNFDRALGIRERALRFIATEARITPELDRIRSDEDAVYSLLLVKEVSMPLRALALRMSLLRKGRTAEAALMTGWALQKGMTSDEQRARFNRWQALREQHEALFFRGPAGRADSDARTHQTRLEELKMQIDSLEHEMARAAPLLARWRLPAAEEILDQVAASLPVGSALVEVLGFCPVKFQSKGPEANRRSPPRYVALILFPDKRIESVDLGEAEPVDRSAGALLVSIRDVSQEPLREAQALYQKVMAPLLAKLGNVQRLYLSLDGSLNLVPFAALHDGKQYLLDAPFQILYLSSGRDLLRGVLGQSQQPALVMADPDFHRTATRLKQGESRTIDGDTRSLYDGLTTLEQLKGARAEGALIGSLLHVSPLLGAAATEARLRQLRAPSILHIATHGLFLNSAMPDSRSARATMVGARPKDTFNQLTGRTQDHSLSRSALVLAGAANASTARDAANDGLLTGEEARSLSLFGTQLVVLSACDTGRGTVKVGQGVYGLRRAFLAAGAQTVVMSLWPVSDASTQGLMQRYYQLLLDKKAPRGRIGGLTEAMRAVKSEHPHPYYWAPFIANGLDAPLRLLPVSRRL